MDYFRPALFVAVPFAGSIPNGLLTRKAINTWFDKLKIAPWSPPKWVFAPVWSTLHAGMGTASYLVYRDGGGFSGEAKSALTLYGVMLAFNWSWTPLFFGARRFGLAFGDLLALTGCIVGTIYSFLPINKTAAYLLMPYLAWVTYASTCNYYVWRNNPTPIEQIKEDTKDE